MGLLCPLLEHVCVSLEFILVTVDMVLRLFRCRYASSLFLHLHVSNCNVIPFDKIPFQQPEPERQEQVKLEMGSKRSCRMAKRRNVYRMYKRGFPKRGA